MFLFLKQIPAVERIIKRNPFFYSEFRQALEQMEDAGLEQRRAAAQRLRARVVGWASKLSGYRDYDFARPFGDLPLLSKAKLQSETGHFQRRTLVPQVEVATSGTTGVPLRLKRSIQSLAIEQAMFDWMAAKVGLDYGNSRIAVLRGDEVKDPNDPAPPYWGDVGRSKVTFSSMHLNSRTFPHYERKLQEFQPDILTCYPSSLELLTHLAEARNSSIAFKLAITSSETLGAGLRERVKRVFGAAASFFPMPIRSCSPAPTASAASSARRSGTAPSRSCAMTSATSPCCPKRQRQAKASGKKSHLGSPPSTASKGAAPTASSSPTALGSSAWTASLPASMARLRCRSSRWPRPRC